MEGTGDAPHGHEEQLLRRPMCVGRVALRAAKWHTGQK
jgi:hypothetical protein